MQTNTSYWQTQAAWIAFSFKTVCVAQHSPDWHHCSWHSGEWGKKQVHLVPSTPVWVQHINKPQGGRYTSISGDLGPVVLYLQHWVNKLIGDVLPSVLLCSRNISSMHEEISCWKMQIRTVTLIRVGVKAGTWGFTPGGESCSPIHCHPPSFTATDLFTFLKGQLKFLNSAVTDKESKVLLKNSSEANYFSFCCRLWAIYWGFACSCLKLDLICLSSKCCKCKAISFTGFN